MQTADILRLMLLLCCVGMAVLALFSLRQRRLLWWQFILWETLAIAVPLLGPFIVIAFKPGEDHTHRLKRFSRF